MAPSFNCLSRAASLRRARAVLLGAALCGSAALAYVLPGGAILRHLAHVREDLHLTTLRVDGTVSFYGDALREAGTALQLPVDKPEAQADASLALRFPARCRLDVTTSEGSRLAVIDANSRRRNEGGVVQGLSFALEQVCRVLAPYGSSEVEMRADLDRYLRTVGIDARLTSLDRQGDQVVYVLGRPGPNDPQFGVFKDSFLPARIRVLDAARVVWEARFVDYSSPSAGESFPRVVEVSRGGEKLVRFTVLKADSHPSLPERLFANSP